MLARIGQLVTRRSTFVLVTALIVLVVSGAIGGGVASHLVDGGFDDRGSESYQADEALIEEFGVGTPNVILLVTAVDGSVDDAAVAEAGTALTAELAGEEGVDNVISYWSAGNAPPLRSGEGDRALVLGRIAGDDTETISRGEEIREEFTRDGEVVDVAVGGESAVFSEVNDTVEDDLLRAEMIALPITLILLLLVFGSLVAAVLPLGIGILSIVGTFLVLRGLAELTDVSIFALNLTTAMGLGLAIDYSLFIISRYREELHAGHAPPEAVSRTVRTAGRTVMFSALTVAASLCALLVFPIAFLRSFAYAGVAVAFLAGLFSVVVLPAVLVKLGHRVNSLTLWKRSVTPPEQGMWHRVATFVMRRPIPVATAAILLLVTLGLPFVGINLGLPDDRVLPEDASTHQVHEVIRNEFASNESGSLSVLVEGIGDPTTDQRRAEIDTYASELAQLPHVSRVDALTGIYCGEGLAADFGCEPGTIVPSDNPQEGAQAGDDGTYLSVVPDVEPLSDEGQDLVHDVRNLAVPFDASGGDPADVRVTGSAATLVDSNDALLGRLPIAVGIVAIITFAVLFMFFGSVIIPLKALALNVLSLSAMFGAMVWVFQDGHLSGVLDFTATGSLAASMPVLMFCVAFGLSMDYEVFLLSRIKEEHDRGAGTIESVAVGLERTGRIVSAAAVLISVVMLAFATSQVSFIKLFGIGLALAILMDAFVIRGTLVPAFMRLAGGANWWAPGPLRRFHDRFGVSEHVDLDGGDDSVGGTGGRDGRAGHGAAGDVRDTGRMPTTSSGDQSDVEGTPAAADDERERVNGDRSTISWR